MASIMPKGNVNHSLAAQILSKTQRPTQKNASHAILVFILFIFNQTVLAYVRQAMLLSKIDFLWTANPFVEMESQSLAVRNAMIQI